MTHDMAVWTESLSALIRCPLAVAIQPLRGLSRVAENETDAGVPSLKQSVLDTSNSKRDLKTIWSLNSSKQVQLGASKFKKFRCV